MELGDYPEWERALHELSAGGGTVLLVGGIDTGKTTFCTVLANAALEAGRRAAVVDADIGQSEIGPPTCVGMGVAEKPIRVLAEIPARALAFVGSTAPRGNLMEHVVAVRAMADAARAENPHLLMVDTTGFIHGPAARRLKDAKFSLLTPDHVVVLQRGAECESLLTPLRYSDRVQIHRLPVPSVIAAKPPALRAQRRAGRFARYFQDAAEHPFDFENVALIGSWLNEGMAVPPHLLRFISNAFNLRVYYAEEQDRHLGVVTDRLPVGEQGIGLLQEQFRSQAVTITPASRLRHLLTALCDANGKVLGLGLIESLDLRRRRIGLLSPIRAPSAVRSIRFGTLRVKPDGSEVGTIRSGEV